MVPMGTDRGVIDGRSLGATGDSGAGDYYLGDPTGTMHPEAALSEQKYRDYQSSQRQWIDQAAEDLQVYNGIHWTQDQINTLQERGQTPIAIQVTYQLVEQAVGMLTANDPRFNVAAREDSDTKTAAAIRHLMQWGWQYNDGKQKLRQTIRDYYVQGRGHLYIYVDPNKDFGKGEVCIQSLDPKEVFPDPNSRDPLWDDADHVLIRRLFTKEQVHQNFPHFDLNGVRTDLEETFSTTARSAHNDEIIFHTDINDTNHDKYEVLERFTKVWEQHYRLFNPHTGRDEILSEAAFTERLKDMAFIVQEGGIERVVTEAISLSEYEAIFNAYGPVSHLTQPPAAVGPDGQLAPQGEPQRVPGEEALNPSAIPGSELRIEPVTIEMLVNAGVLPMKPFLLDRIKVVASIGGKLLYEPFTLPTSHYPIITFNNTHNRNPYPISDVHRIRDLQDGINKTQSLILAHAANSTNQKVFYPAGAVADKKNMEENWGKAGTAFIEYDPMMGGGGAMGGIVLVSPQPLAAELYHNMDRYISQIHDILGIYPFMQGDATASPQTYKGTMAIDQMGFRRIKSKLEDIYCALARAGKVWLNMAQQVYTSEKVTRIIMPDGKDAEQYINQIQFNDYGVPIARINDVTVGHYDVVIQAGSTLPSDRWAMLEAYKEMYQMGLVDQQTVLKKAEIPDADQILERTSIIQQLQAQLEQAQEEIKRLSGDLQTAEREEMTAKQKAELEKYKRSLHESQVDMRKASQLYNDRLNDQLQLQAKQASLTNQTQPQQ